MQGLYEYSVENHNHCTDIASGWKYEKDCAAQWNEQIENVRNCIKKDTAILIVISQYGGIFIR